VPAARGCFCAFPAQSRRNLSAEARVSFQNFDDQLATGAWLLEFYAPWCGHCRRLEPVFKEVFPARSLARMWLILRLLSRRAHPGSGRAPGHRSSLRKGGRHAGPGSGAPLWGHGLSLALHVLAVSESRATSSRASSASSALVARTPDRQDPFSTAGCTTRRFASTPTRARRSTLYAPASPLRECNLSSSPPRVKARRVPMREYLQSGFICERGMEGAGTIILDLPFAARPTVRPPPCSALRPKPRAPRCSRSGSRRARLAAGGSWARSSTSSWASRRSTRACAPTTVAPSTLPEAGQGAATVLHVVPSQKQNRGRAQRPLLADALAWGRGQPAACCADPAARSRADGGRHEPPGGAGAAVDPDGVHRVGARRRALRAGEPAA